MNKKFNIEAKIGPMAFVPIKRIVARDHKSIVIYEIILHGAKVAATALHAFKILRKGKDMCVTADSLQPGDKMWIDLSAFMSDGSISFK